jgi:hypothetical protein
MKGDVCLSAWTVSQSFRLTGRLLMFDSHFCAEY